MRPLSTVVCEDVAGVVSQNEQKHAAAAMGSPPRNGKERRCQIGHPAGGIIPVSVVCVGRDFAVGRAISVVRAVSVVGAVSVVNSAVGLDELSMSCCYLLRLYCVKVRLSEDL